MKCALVMAVATGFLLMCCGCSSPGRATYPIGIFGVPATSMDAVRQAGFNFVVGPAQPDYLDRAGEAGLGVFASPNTAWTTGDRLTREEARQLRKLDAHRALHAWYLFDEPDLDLVSPERVTTANRSLKVAGARKPTVLSLSQGYQALNYGRITDVVMVDRYPVPWLPLANFGQHMNMARLGLGKEGKLIAVIQAFDWSFFPELLPGESNLRPPTHEELRCMTYEALARGADGIAFFDYEGRWKICEHPAVWESLQSVVAEINARSPLFLAARPWWPREHDFANREDRFNAALESSVSSVLLRVRSGNHDVPSGSYVLAVNNTPRELTYGFTPLLDKGRPAIGSDRVAPDSEDRVIAVLGEDRAVASKDAWIWDQFKPYAVHIYGPF